LDLDGTGDVCDGDRDGDGAPNAIDCAADDSSAFSIPSPAHTLVMAGSTLNWATPVIPGGLGLRYDLLRSESATGFSAPQCVVSNTASEIANDATTPNAGESFFYLVRAKNSCGGNLGTHSSGAPRSAGGCP
jgi:hypothetical protein